MALVTDPAAADRSLLPNGQQADYVILSDEERAKGYIRPMRIKYRHKACGSVTQMPIPIAATYARQPDFYTGTFCCACGKHFPLVDADGKRAFLWDDGSGQHVGE